MPDKRLEKRFPAEIQVSFRSSKARGALVEKKGVTGNISWSGFLLLSSPYDTLPDEMAGTLHVPGGDPVAFKGRVAWVGPFHPSVRQAGVRFTEVNEADRSRLRDLQKNPPRAA